jgi:polysaccharide export outer membrane protein
VWYRSTALVFALLLVFGRVGAEEVPAPSSPITGNYSLQPGDVIQVAVWKEADLTREVLVRPDGSFSFPLAGDILAEGRTVEQVRAELMKRLEKFIPEPEVSVAVKETFGNKIYVIGKVNKPGEFVIRSPIDVMQALSIAGGTTTFAKVSSIKILRRKGQKQVAIPFDYDDVEDGDDLQQNILLQNGDVVVVP